MDNIRAGFWRFMVPVPRFIWKRQLPSKERQLTAGTSFMSPEHRSVRRYAVEGLARTGRPLPAESIAHGTGLSLERVTAILDDLQQHLTFLFRNEEGAVTWAYPVTVDPTPHHVSLTTGESMYAP
jgi:hypothetical protein